MPTAYFLNFDGDFRFLEFDQYLILIKISTTFAVGLQGGLEGRQAGILVLKLKLGVLLLKAHTLQYNLCTQGYCS